MAISGDAFIAEMLGSHIAKKIAILLNARKATLQVFAAAMLLMGELASSKEFRVSEMLEHVLEAISLDNEDAVAGALRVISHVTESGEEVARKLCRRDYLGLILGHLHSENRDVRVPAAVSAGNLCNRSQKCAEFFYENGVIEASEKLFHKEWVDKVNTCHIICGLLASLEHFCKEFWDSGALPSVFEALSDRHLEAMRAGVNALSCAIERSSRDTVMLILNAKTLDPYFKLLLKGDEKIALRICAVIARLVKGEEEKNRLLVHLKNLFTNKSIEKLLMLPHRELINRTLMTLIDSRTKSSSEYINMRDTERLKKMMMSEEMERFSQAVERHSFFPGAVPRACFSTQ